MKIKTLMFTLLIFYFFSFLFLDARGNEYSLIEDLSIGVDYGDENLMFGSVSAIFLDSAENIYILDWKNDRIQKFDRDGHFLKSILIIKGQGPEEVSMLGGVALHPDGKISLFDRGGSKIINLNEEGEFISSFKLDYMPTSIASLGENRIAILGLKESKIIHVFDIEGNHLNAFGEPFPLPGRLSQYKDVPLGRHPIRFDCSPDGKVFLVSPHEYEIWIYMDGKLEAKVKGQSERFQPMMIRVSGEGEKKRMSLVWAYVTVLEHKGRLFAGIRYFGRKRKNHLEIFEAGKSAAILEISGLPYAVDR